MHKFSVVTMSPLHFPIPKDETNNISRDRKSVPWCVYTNKLYQNKHYLLLVSSIYWPPHNFRPLEAQTLFLCLVISPQICHPLLKMIYKPPKFNQSLLQVFIYFLWTPLPLCKKKNFNIKENLYVFAPVNLSFVSLICRSQLQNLVR